MGQSSKHHDYHLVDPSPWPLLGSFSALAMFYGLVQLMHGKAGGHIIFPLGLFGVIAVMYVWWRDVTREGSQKHHSEVVSLGLRIGMALFILSEVMFFFGFFWSFFKSAIFPMLVYTGDYLFEIGNTVTDGIWPPKGIETLNAWDLPLMNTLVLLLSGCTVTWAHYALLKDNRKDFIKALAVTVALGAFFTFLQIVEYGHATFGFTEGIYSSNFYMATGFHGAHVLIGTIFLLVCLFRAMKGQMSSRAHLGFEFAAWYWHFVDVVWIFLFIFVYVWGA